MRSYSSPYNLTAIRPILGSLFIGNFLPTYGYWKRFETCDKFFRKRKFLQQRRHLLSARKVNFLKSKEDNGCRDKQEIHFGINSQSLLETSASSFPTFMPVSFETECAWVEKLTSSLGNVPWVQGIFVISKDVTHLLETGVHHMIEKKRKQAFPKRGDPEGEGTGCRA